MPKSLGASVRSQNSLGASVRSNKSNKSTNEFDIVAVKTKSSECPAYEGDGLSLASLGVSKDQQNKYCVHWQQCPNFSSLYGDGGELNVPPPSGINEDGSVISHGGISYERTGSGKYRAANGESLPGSAMGAIFQNEQVIKFGGVAFERTASGHFVSKDGQQLSNGAMGQIFGGFVSSGDLGGFDNFNADGSVRQYVNPYANMPFGRFAAIDAIVAEGQWRMAAKKKENGEEIEVAAPVKPKKYNPTFDSSRIGSHPMTPDAQSSDYKSEYSRSFSHEDRIKSSDRIKNGKIYKVVCDNLKQNLQMLENYEKYSTNKETKALYLSIIDAAISGPHKMTLAEAEFTLGVSKAAIRQASGTYVKKKLRPVSTYGSFVHSNGNKANKHLAKDPAEALRQQFQAFASFGKDRHKDGSHITLSQIDRWFKQGEIIDGDSITTTDTAIVFKKISGSCPWLTFREFLKFLEMFADDQKLVLNEIKKKLAICGAPVTTNHTEADNAPIIDRLTDVSTYPNTHKHRFTHSGRGRGLEGRREPTDILALQRQVLDLLKIPGSLIPVTPRL